MKMRPFLAALCLIVGLSAPALAAKKKAHHQPAASNDEETAAPKDTQKDTQDQQEQKDQPNQQGPKAEEVDHAAETTGASVGDQSVQKPLDFDFFGAQSGAAEAGKGGGEAAGNPRLADEARTRRWMLSVHQTLGIATWLSMAATVTVGQLNYNQLYGGGGGSNKWQTPHRALVISTSALFAAAATFALLAPTPYKKPLRLDTGLIHRVAVIGATLGMVTEGVLGWWTTHQANAGNPHNLRTMARAHQIVGYTTLGFLTVAGTVWLF